MKELRVIQIVDSLRVGGAEVLAVNIANGLAKKGILSHICVTREEGPLTENVNENVEYFFLDRKKTLDFSALKRLISYIKKHKINTIHAHSTSYFIAACVKLLRPNVKVIWHDHYGKSDLLEKRKSTVLKISSLFMKSVIVVNSKLFAWAKKTLLVKNVIYLPNFGLFENDQKMTHLKGEEGKRIVHVAGFRPQKDHLNLLKAFKSVRTRFPDWTLHLIGKDYGDEYANSIKAYIEENKLSDAVFIYGVCLDLKNILSQGTIGVLSSESEGLPVSLLEYGLAGLPVLVTDVGECSSVVKNKNAIVDSRDAQKFSESLVFLIENKNERDKVAKDVSSVVEEKHTLEVFLNSLLKIYKS